MVFDQVTDAEYITRQQEHVSVRNSRHPTHEIPGELPFLIRQLRLRDKVKAVKHGKASGSDDLQLPHLPLIH